MSALFIGSAAFILRLLCTDESFGPSGPRSGVRSPAMVQLAAEGTLSGELGVTLWLSASVLGLSQSWVPGKWAARWE